MDFENLAKTWESFGKEDPLWSILAWEGKEKNQWDPEAFFEVGEQEVAYILGQCAERYTLPRTHRAMDFGCGVGRLTFPLARNFGESHGVDISSEMIARADLFKAAGKPANAHFHHNRRHDLSLFPDGHFDFVLSLIVLQHMEPRYFTHYIREFLRVTADNGMILFQLPDALECRARYDAFDEDTEPEMEMYGMAQAQVVTLLEENGGEVLEVIKDESCGPDVLSHRYFVTKRPGPDRNGVDEVRG